MGGNQRKPTKKAEAKNVENWLQDVIDALASEYGWTKDHIFSLFPKEVEILMESIKKRREQETDMRQYQLAIAACVPHMQDGGKEFLNNILSKYKQYDDGGDVTAETIERDNNMAKKLLGM